MKAIVGVSGASGAVLGLKLALELEKICDTHLIISHGASEVLRHENSIDTSLWSTNFKGKIYSDTDLAAPISSGSFMSDVVFIVPCSISTLGKVASGISDTLITRTAAVALKQRQRLILGVREMPFSTLCLEQMALLSSYGAIIAPPVIAHYAGTHSLGELENFIIGKWLDAANIPNKLYTRWQQ